ncbi:MAG: dehydrogenase [Planctomycetaceae bacterium]|nr:dehydrogenase [Planctomycetaceae bacterium]
MVRFMLYRSCLPSAAAQWLISLPLLLGMVLPISAADWTPVEIPQHWKANSEDGTSWYRCGATIPSEWQESPIQIFVESVDDARELYFNGRRIGGLGTFPPEYRSGLGRSTRFEIPEEIIDYGNVNVIAIRVHRNQSRSGFNVAVPVIFGTQQAIRLRGPWEVAQEEVEDEVSVSARQQIPATSIFNKLESAEIVEEQLKRLDNDPGPQLSQTTVDTMRHPEQFSIQVALAEPHIGQPLSFKWDERGRLWVCEYRQYPDPAGLRMISRDKFLRTVYDKIPLPPPHHARGLDRISIHEDKDGNGIYESHQVFVDGLNLATSFAFGRDGLWVLNPPYLLFYPDADRDDIPDGDPEVHLEGFGLEDTHSLANSLRWGPDGWLYGAQGSTVSGRVKGYRSDDEPVTSMGQLIWRYHPERRQYEIFAEGGGNAFGLEIDDKGRIYSGHNGGNTRAFHYPQGGYLRKGFGKHGQLSNPYAFGYLPAMAHHNSPRFTHAFVIYDADLFPSSFHGKLFSVAPLQGEVVQSRMEPLGSTFRSEDEGYLFQSEDRWCRPVDIQVGPDGAIYVADFYEQRIDHASHYQGRVHRDSGRIYRIYPTAKTDNVSLPVDLDDATLVRWLNHPNKWYRQTAVRLLKDRQPSKLIPTLLAMLQEKTNSAALEALWALNQIEPLSDESGISLLDHQDPHVRRWTIRLLCDRKQLTPRLAQALAQLARDESDIEVRAQLACSAKRLNPGECLAIVKGLVHHSDDVKDSRMPLLIWWAIESKADDPHTLATFCDSKFAQQPLVEEHLLNRIMRRYAQSGSRKDLLSCARLLQSATQDSQTKQYLVGFEAAYQGRSLQGLPLELSTAIIDSGGGSFELRLRQEDSSSLKTAMQGIIDNQVDATKRADWINILSELKHPPAVAPLLALAISDQTPIRVRLAACGGLQAFESDAIGDELVASLSKLPTDVREAACATLVSRPKWSATLLDAIEQEELPDTIVSPTHVAHLFLHRNSELQTRLQAIWQDIPGATTDFMRAEIDRLNRIVKTGSGVPRNGKSLFMERCGKCHQLFEDGGSIGPNLTEHDRRDLQQMLVNVVNPSLTLREGYESHVVMTDDGRTMSGLMIDQDNQVVIIKDHQGNTQLIPREGIEEIAKIPRSLMPEDTLQDLDDQQIRDLFAYLRSAQPLP